MDKYEASVWRVPVPTTINKDLVTRIRQGRATAADLQKGGARRNQCRGSTRGGGCHQREPDERPIEPHG
jgi:hypothetical protein